MTTFPTDYAERVYAGVLGKIIGVYSGRPFEGWPYDAIAQKFGDVSYYVHEQLKMPLIVTDDDISGTFSFVRALEEHGYDPDITPAQIGRTWLNLIIENRTILWWGGLGVSTEHTAFLRLQNGIEAPRSGSMELNGRVVAEQIGAQIFIDGWGLINPGDPERAADFARRAGSVSHDGEAIYGAQVVAALVAGAFVEGDLNTLLDTARALVPRDCTVGRVIDDMREWRTQSDDWRETRGKLVERYGYEKFGGGCHMVPNHAVVMLGLLYGEDDFGRALTVTNTAAYDTDCNAANVGCILGVKNGLRSLDAGADWRGPVADRLYLPTADGGRAITDAVRETLHLVNTAHRVQGQEFSPPKNGARYSFAFPGSVQGFLADESFEARGVASVSHDAIDGVECLRVSYANLASGRAARAETATFSPLDAIFVEHYGMVACPTLYSGQTVRARLRHRGSATLNLFARVYGKDDKFEILRGETQVVGDAWTDVSWTLPDTDARPIQSIGLEATHAGFNAVAGDMWIDRIDWNNMPRLTLGRPDDIGEGKAWRRAWVDTAGGGPEWWIGGLPHTLLANHGDGLRFIGENSWRDYTVRADVQSHMSSAFGLLAAGRGLRRFVSLTLESGESGRIARLSEHYDGQITALAEESCAWEFDAVHAFSLSLLGNGQITGRVGDVELQGRVEAERARGAAGFYVREGNAQAGALQIAPLEN